jgi:predicted transcriptional regulator
MRARDKYDIFSDILKAAGHRNMGSTITEVTKEASLNPEQAKEVIIDMLEIGLLEFSKEKTLKTTTKGWRFVRIYENLIEFMPISSKIEHMSVGAS